MRVHGADKEAAARYDDKSETVQDHIFLHKYRGEKCRWEKMMIKELNIS